MRRPVARRSFRPYPMQTGQYIHKRWLEALKLEFSKKRDCTISVAKAKALISCTVACAKSKFSHYVLIYFPVIFMKWKAALGLIETEKQEAADVRTILDLSQLRRCYDRWKAGTKQLLTIKPMVTRYRQKLVTM